MSNRRPKRSRNERLIGVAITGLTAVTLLAMGWSNAAVVFSLLGFLQGPLTGMIRSRLPSAYHRMGVLLRLLAFTPLVFGIVLYAILGRSFGFALLAMWCSWAAGMLLFVPDEPVT
jgi:hypothetical protein